MLLPAPAPPLPLAGGPGPRPLLLPVQLRERPGPLPRPEARQAAAAVESQARQLRAWLHVLCQDLLPAGTVPAACPLLLTWHPRDTLQPHSACPCAPWGVPHAHPHLCAPLLPCEGTTGSLQPGREPSPGFLIVDGQPPVRNKSLLVISHGKSHGWRNLVGYSPWGRKELDTTEVTYAWLVLRAL